MELDSESDGEFDEMLANKDLESKEMPSMKTVRNAVGIAMYGWDDGLAAQAKGIQRRSASRCLYLPSLA